MWLGYIMFACLDDVFPKHHFTWMMKNDCSALIWTIKILPFNKVACKCVDPYLSTASIL